MADVAMNLFASPLFLMTLVLVPVLTAVLAYEARARRHALSQLGSPTHLRRSLIVRGPVRRLKVLFLLAAILVLGIACARPQWGEHPDAPRRRGRDVVIVLDVSRSMLAEQPSRLERACRALRNLANTLEADGGDRVALILFAARPELLFPLTQDYDHLRQAVDRIQVRDYPSLKHESSPSGTRIGAAVQLAMETCGPARANRPTILLLSDGDDPANDADQEWRGGAAQARARRIRVHTVGFGDPGEAHTIPVGKDRLLYDGKPVLTRLHEDRLRDLAGYTSGEYLPARLDRNFRLGTLLRVLLDADALTREEPTGNVIPMLQDRYVWFLGPGLVFLMMTMLLSEGIAMQPRTVQRPRRSMRGRSAIAALALLIVSAASPGTDDLIRQGDEAFARQQYELAIRCYERAEEHTVDPGRVAFNKAAAFFQLKRYREAIESYRRCLDDDQVSPRRRALAQFNLGNALVQHAAGDASLLAQAAAAYRACLTQPELGAKLRDDARHNLQIAQQLWLQARQAQSEPPKSNGSKPSPIEPDEKSQWTPADPKKKEKIVDDPDAPEPQKSNHLRSQGMPQVLRDDDQVRAISVADTAATLDQAAERIAEKRRQHRHADGPATVTTKDW